MENKLSVLFPDSANRVVEWNKTFRDGGLPTVEEQVPLVVEELKELFKATEESDVVGMLDGIADIFVTGAMLEHIDPEHTFSGVAYTQVDAGIRAFGHTIITEAIMEVLDSNDTKFVHINNGTYKDEKHLKAMISEEIKRLTKEHNIDVGGKVVGENVVFIDVNGKLRKPYCYRSPNLKEILVRHGVL